MCVFVSFRFLINLYCFRNFCLWFVTQNQDWESATQVAKAFNIGPKEAHALSNLQARVDPTVVEDLKQRVAIRGMKTFLSHELIAKEIFNDGFSSGQGGSEAWLQHLTNSSDLKLASWLQLLWKLYFCVKPCLFHDIVLDSKAWGEIFGLIAASVLVGSC